jgi:hypothetical protein
MRRVFQSFAAIAGLTLREMLRQPLTLLLTATAVAGMGLMPILTTHTLGEGEKIIADNALALHFFLGLLLAGTAACQSLSGDIRRGTAATILSKPVGRVTFLLAKFAGIAGGMLLFSAVAAPASMIAMRSAAPSYAIDWPVILPLLAAIPVAFAAAAAVNYLTRRPFVSDAIGLLAVAVFLAFVVAGLQPKEGEAAARFGAFFTWTLLPVNVLIAMALLLLAAIALALATRLDVVPTVTLCSVVFLVGLMSDYLFGRHAATSRVAAALYAVLPNWQHFWVVDALHLDVRVPAAYLAKAGAYAGLYLIGILALAIFSFRSTEVKT